MSGCKGVFCCVDPDHFCQEGDCGGCAKTDTITSKFDKDDSFDISRLLKELWQYSDTGDYGAITYEELKALLGRCRA